MTQQEYLEILFNDLGMERKRRNAWLSHIFRKEVHYLDDLSVSQRSHAIDLLKEMKHVPDQVSDYND